MEHFWINQAIKYVILYATCYATGRLVLQAGMRVNYTRKINHFVFYLAPMLLDLVLPYRESMLTGLLGGFLTIAVFFTYMKPFRDRIPFIRTVFSSFDRPEDRPYTLFWLTTQLVAGYLIVIPMVMLFKNFELLPLISIPILINGIGDGLAEPVGVRWGRHFYSVKAFFSDKTFVRTLEGSACVFVTTIVVWAAFKAYFTPEQFLLGLAVLPVVMTLAEALSPHTWDTPLMFLAGYSTVFAIAVS